MAQALSHVGRDAQSPGAAKIPIQQAPMEIILDIMELLGPRDLGSFGLVNRHFYQIYKEKRTQLLLNILRGCPELEVLLHLYRASESDFLPWRMLHPLTVTFNLGADNAPESKVFLKRSSVHWKNGRIVCPEKVKLNKVDLLKLAELVDVIDWWVEIYPRLRWREHPEDRRCLKYDETACLRKAMARWWLYSHYFHGNYWRNTHVPKKFDEDVRLHHIRILTTQEIHELDDLLGIMYETVSRDLCSSPGKVYGATGGSAIELIPWGRNGDRHQAIVNTYMKLGPELLKYFLEHCYRYNKEYLIMAITNSTKDLLFDRETLSMSIATVLQERLILDPKRPKKFPPMGIIAEDRADDKQCEAWNQDAWPTGFPPISDDQLAAQPLELTSRVPRGDDGTERGGGY